MTTTTAPTATEYRALQSLEAALCWPIGARDNWSVSRSAFTMRALCAIEWAQRGTFLLPLVNCLYFAMRASR
jgi:hypothetical protein